MNKYFCDKCGNEIDTRCVVKIELQENGKYIFKHFHIDCFNYEFSCDIRKIKEI